MIWKEVDNQIVVLDIEKSTIYELNEIGSLIWKSSGKYCTVDTLAEKIKTGYEVNPKVLLEDLISFLNKNSFLFKLK